jgi:HSP20 family molecular chaperone IbpA
MSTRNPTDWMWAQACEMIEQAERMHRQFFRLATSAQASTVWEPPVDVLEDERGVVVIVALPGVSADAIEVAHEGGEFVVRAVRRLPSPGARGLVHQLEIPHGRFERRIRVPGIRVEESTREMLDGCLILRLSKAPRGGGR